MTDFYEIDFLAVETKSSGDAIALRYEIDAEQFIHVVDAGYYINNGALSQFRPRLTLLERKNIFRTYGRDDRPI